MNGIDSLQQTLASEDRILFIKRMRVCLYYMAVPLVVSFSFVDFLFAPEHIKEFLWARLLVIPLSFLFYQFYRIKWISKNYYQFPAHLFVVYLGILNTYMAWQTGAEASPYYAGLNLVGIAAFGFLPWNWVHMLITAVFLYGPYFVFAATKHNLDFKFFIPHSAFIISTMFMGGLVTLLSRQLRLAELRSRLALENQIHKQDTIIKEKTTEGIYLEKLATQFSPQVIDAIKNGQISLDKRQRKEITCIFIDVENSTGRSLRIDHSDYTDTLSDFFSNCVDVFLKHDVTVGTYLGDGILAFINAPQSNEKHQEVALQACLEILEHHNYRRRFYKEKWRHDFKIRIGINSGFASVGFFPNSNRGTYTAVGEPVNLAARLCGKAQPNSICVTKSYLKGVGTGLSGVIAEFMESCTNIKGFELDLFELFSVRPNITEVEIIQGRCPLCHSKLLVKSDLGKSALVQCEKCNYSDIVDDEYPKTDTKAS
jgi:adenylate cyclase